jgi:LPS-assembly protein
VKNDFTRRLVLWGFHFLFALFLTVSPGEAQQREGTNSYIYYDADQTQVDAKNGDLRTKGNVLFLIGDAFISADEIIFLKEKQIATAEGNVKLVRGKEMMRASRVVYDLRAQEARMDSVEIISDPTLNEQTVNEEFLGFSRAEVAFEKSREEREKEIIVQLRSLREEYLAAQNLKKLRRGVLPSADEGKSDQLRRRYAQLLERLSRTRYQPNIALSTVPEETKRKLEDRRKAAKEFSKKNPDVARKLAGLDKFPSYVNLRASSVYQKPDGTYEIENATITPCKCYGDEPPIWSFSARSANIEVQEYVTLYGTTFDLGAVPIAYSPWIKFPIKTRRQTGLLIPSLYASRSGDAISQPLFITLGEHADTTLTLNNFSLRGTRVDLEGRVQISPTSYARVYGEFLEDRKYLKESRDQKATVEQFIDRRKSSKEDTLTAEKEDQLRRQYNDRKLERWYSEGSANVPLTGWAAVKGEAQLVSDNRYLTDFDKDSGNDLNKAVPVIAQDSQKTSFFPDLKSKRFLSQEVAAEYYGSDVVFSVRAQGTKDLFTQDISNTPMRIPRAEFYLLPKRYFDLPVAFEGMAAWERVHRLGGSGFLDLPATPTGGVPPVYSPTTVNGRKDPGEPYIEGERSALSSSATLPLKRNNFVNASVSAKSFVTQYNFPEFTPIPKLKPYQTYNAYVADADIPLYSVLRISQPNNAFMGQLRQDLVPSASFTYIPSVQKSAHFPNQDQVFYVQDAVTITQKLEVSLDSNWRLIREGFNETPLEIQRMPAEQDPGVANEEIFLAVMKDQSVNPTSVLELSNTAIAPQLFLQWADKELSAYETKVSEGEFGQRFVWPGTTSYRYAEQWQMNPLRVNIKSGYNFAEKERVSQLNSELPSTSIPNEEKPWDDVVGTLSWAVSPFLPISGSFSGGWNPNVGRVVRGGMSLAVSIDRIGWNVGYSNSYERKEYINATTFEKVPYQIRTITLASNYSPLKWLNFHFDRTQTMGTDSRKADGSPMPTIPELQYQSTQSISFLGIQDCLDIVFGRTKSKEQKERYATWSVGLNLAFFGNKRTLEAGDSLNRAVHSRNEELSKKEEVR